jgi:membrane protease subunit (stomatin/prohibitin family)
MCIQEINKFQQNVASQSKKQITSKSFDRYKADKWDPLSKEMQEGNVSGKLASDADQFLSGNVHEAVKVGGDEVARWGGAVASVFGIGNDGQEQQSTSDSISANYSKSSSEKSSQSNKKAKKDSRAETGGSKRQFNVNS